MKLTQELPAEMRERLEEEAARRGEEPDALLLSLVGASLSRLLAAMPEPNVVRLRDIESIEAAEGDREDFNADDEAERFRRWADGQPRRGMPVIPLEALDREHIYGDHA